MQAAVAAGNVLVVCYFDGEVGQGKVKWEEVAAPTVAVRCWEGACGALGLHYLMDLSCG